VRRFLPICLWQLEQIESHPARPARWDVYAKLADENQRYLWGILDNASKPNASRTPVEQKIGDYFSACMDEAAVERPEPRL